MRFDDLWITGTGSALGQLRPVAPEVAAGRYAPRDAAEAGTVSVSISDQAPPELAVRAGRAALDMAGDAAARPGLHLHASTYFQGLDMWPAACWIWNQLLDPVVPGLALEVGAMSNGALAALELGASLLAGRPDVPAALLTAADRFAGPGMNRWSGSSGMALGDGAGAVLLGRGGGLLRLLSCVSVTDTTMEGLRRGNEPFHPASPAAVSQVDIRQRTRDFFTGGAMTVREVQQRSELATRTVVKTALEDAGCAMADVRWTVPPFVGGKLFHFAFADPLGLDPGRSLHGYGLTTGHLGAADQFVGLDHLMRECPIGPGERILLIGVGSGCTFSAAVLGAG